jgi:hypothetical protein
MLRRGNAGANTAADHITVFDQALAQIPDAHRYDQEILIRADTAGCTKAFLAHIRSQREHGVACEFSVGWAITERERHAIELIPKQVWADAVDADGGHRDGAGLAEITRLLPAKALDGYPDGTRVTVRRERPHPGAQLDLMETRSSAGGRSGLHERGNHLQAGTHSQGQQTIARFTGQLGQDHAHRVGHGGLAPVDLLVLGSPCARRPPVFVVFLAVHPSTYRTAGLRRGTATSTSTSSGTTSTARSTPDFSARHVAHPLVSILRAMNPGAGSDDCPANWSARCSIVLGWVRTGSLRDCRTVAASRVELGGRPPVRRPA